MRDKQLRRLFLRWRDRSDTAALGRVFDAVAPGLFALASHLVREGDRAEDLLQTTFLTAIEAAGRYDGDRPLQPWLAGILVRKARRMQRDEARGIDPERRTSPPVPEPIQSAERTELTGHLEAALASLPERYRAVLTPFLFEGRRPREIAAAQGLAPGTVRVQLHRGLEQLRRALPTGLALGAAAVSFPRAVGRGLEAVRSHVLSAAGGVPVAAGVTPWLGKALAAGAAATLVTLGVATAHRPSPEPGAARAPSPEDDVALVGGTTLDATALVAPDRPAQRAQAPTAQEPDERARARLRELLLEAPEDEEQEQAPVPGLVRGRVLAPASHPLDLTEARVSYRIETDLGLRFGHPTRDEVGSAHADPDGSFAFPIKRVAKGTVVVEAPGLQVFQVAFAPGVEHDLDVGELQLDVGVSITGTAYREGLPLEAGDEVVAWREGDGMDRLGQSDLVWSGGAFQRRRTTTKVQAGGHFELSGLRSGASYELTAIPRRCGGHSVNYKRYPGDGEEVLAPAANVRLDSTLIAVSVLVRDREGPVPRANVRRYGGGRIHDDMLTSLFGERVDGEGRARFWISPAAELELKISASGYADEQLDVALEDFGPARELTAWLERIEQDRDLVLALEGEGAAAMNGHALLARWFDGGIQHAGSTPAQDGQARFVSFPPEERGIHLSLLLDRTRTPDEQSYAMLFDEIAVPPGAGRDVPVPVPTDLGGRIRLTLSGRADEAAELRLVDAAGDTHAPTLIVARGEGCDTTSSVTEDVLWLGRALAPGSWTIRQVGDAYGPTEQRVLVLPGETSDAQLILRPR